MYLTKTGGGIFSGLGAIVGDLVPNYNVRRGSKNANVSAVQLLLNVFGGNLAVDGIFGPLTEAAVRAFQKSNGLVIDGIVGPITSRALQDDTSRNIGQSPPAKPPSGGGVIPSSGSIGKALLIGAVILGVGVGGVKLAKKMRKRTNPRRRTRSSPRRRRRHR